VRRIAATAVIAIALTVGLAGPASAGVWGTLENHTDFQFTATRFNTGSSTSCVTWNQDGTDQWRPYTWGDCQRYSIGAHTTTGTWFDTDGFRPNYGQSGYWVKFNSGSWKWIGINYFTTIEDDQTARCYQDTTGVVNCTVTG